MSSNDLWDRVRDVALEAGCFGVGVASADPFSATADRIHERTAAGMHAGMHFTFGQPERSTDVQKSFPWARALVVAGFSYMPAAGAPGPPAPNRGRIARFATEDHYRGLRAALGEVEDLLRDGGHRAETLADDNRLVDRAAAVRAGVGWWGKNTMVLSPGAGPWLLLGSVVTDAPLEESAPMVRDCGTCEACLPACPTGALVAPGVLDSRLCLAYWLQSPQWIPIGLRSKVGDRVYGCDDCLDACPPGSKLGEAALPEPRLDLLALLGLEDEELLERYGHFYVPRRRASFLRRNVLVALGNCGDQTAVGTVASYLEDEDPMLRAHAAWALGVIGGVAAGSALEAALATEKEDAVREELTAALHDYAELPTVDPIS